MRGLLKLYKIKRVFVLGAGFGAPLGMPLAPELLKAIHAVARTKPWDDNGPTPKGQADWLVEQLKWYFPLDKIGHASIEKGLLPKNFDLEEFLSYAVASSAFVRKTGEQFNAQGDDKFIAFLKAWIAEAIVKSQKQALTRVTDVYTRFVKSLSKSLILTFNWDTLIENFFDANQIEYAFDLPSIHKTNCIPLIKLHGSVDWFSKPPQFLKKKWMHFESVSKMFSGCYRAKGNLTDYYNLHLTPRLIIPSFDKISQIESLGLFWRSPWIWLDDKLDVIFIGFSMRPDDFHARALFYPQLVRGSRNGSLSVKVIDFASTRHKRSEIKARFAGVKNCQFFFDGFCDRALEFIGVT